MTLIITTARNSCGRGYELYIGGVGRLVCYDYSKREAVKLFRDKYGLNRKHLEVIEF